MANIFLHDVVDLWVTPPRAAAQALSPSSYPGLWSGSFLSRGWARAPRSFLELTADWYHHAPMLDTLLWIAAGFWALALAQFLVNRAFMPSLVRWPLREPGRWCGRR